LKFINLKLENYSSNLHKNLPPWKIRLVAAALPRWMTRENALLQVKRENIFQI